MLGATVWFPIVAWADVALVATGAWRWLDALGIAALTGVLAQAILATLIYLAPILRGCNPATRDRIRARLEVGARTRAVVVSIGVLACVLGAARIVVELPLLGIGWVLLATVTLVALLTAFFPVAVDMSSEQGP